jgi:hypothetical protein
MEGEKNLIFQGIRARMCADVRQVKLVHHCRSEEFIWCYMQWKTKCINECCALTIQCNIRYCDGFLNLYITLYYSIMFPIPYPFFNPYKITIVSFLSKPACSVTVLEYKKVTIKTRHKVRWSCSCAYHHTVKMWESGGTALRIINLSTIWRQVISFIFRPFYPWETSSLCPLDRSPVGPQRWCGLFGGRRTVLPLLGNKPGFPNHPTCRLVYRQSCLGSYMKVGTQCGHILCEFETVQYKNFN